MSEEQPLKKIAQKAKKRYRTGDYPGAAAGFGEAASAYAEAGERRKAAEMRSDQSVALLQMGDARQALDVIQGVVDIFAAAGDTRRQAVALSNQAAALEGLGEKAQAADAYRKAAALFEEIGDDEKQQQVQQALSALQLKSRQPMGALASMLVGLEQLENPTLFQRVLVKVLKVPFRLME